MSTFNKNSLKMKFRDGKAVGLNQAKKLIKSGFAETVFVASDADISICEEVKALCKAFDVTVIQNRNMLALGKECGIDVDCAVYAAVKH